jgi:4-hydroxyphenylpyruvate dioxygenase
MPDTMPDLFANPMGLQGFEFVEFASPTPGVLEPLFERLGFSLVAKHRSKDVLLYRQGQINFIVNRDPKSPAAYFAAEHGPCACGMAFRVTDSHLAYHRALELGAQPLEMPVGPMELRLPAIKGIGGAPLYLIDRFEDGASIYDIDFAFLPGVARHPEGHGLLHIDHLTHNVYRGRMGYWAAFYERLFGFRELRYFDIQGEYTGLTSKAMTAPDGLIRIPLNEESKQGGGQIEEFLMQFNGEGIQHIALICEDLLATVDKLALAGIPLMTAPNSVYYACPATASRWRSCKPGASCSMAAPPAASRACCCKFLAKRCWGRCFSSSSSAKAIKVLARAISRRCLNPWSVTSCAGVRYKPLKAKRLASAVCRLPFAVWHHAAQELLCTPPHPLPAPTV